MNEQEAMARLAAANPIPDPADVPSSQAQFCLRTVLAQPVPQQSRPAPPRTRRRLIAAAAAVAAVAVTGVAVGTTNRPEPPVENPPIAAPRTVFAAAADVAGKAPQPGKFVHTTGTAGRVVHVDSAGGYDVIRVDSVRGLQPAGGLPGEGWLAIGEDGSSVRPLTPADADAYRKDGSPAPEDLPGESDALVPDLAGDPEFDGPVGELPDDPLAAARSMIGRVADDAGVSADPQGWLFRECTRLLDAFTSVLGGADRAKVFRTLSGLTGVRTLDTPTDPLGRPAVGLAYTGATARYGVIDWQVFLRAGTDQIAFTQAVVRQPGPDNATLRPGVVQHSVAVTAVVHSDNP